MFCHSPTTTTATSAPRARSTARASSRRVVEALRLRRDVAGEHVEHRREGALAPDGPPARSRPGPRRPTRARMPSSTVTVSSRSKSKHHGPSVSRCESASGPMHGDRLQRRRVERQQAALVAQQHRRSLGGHPRDLAVGRVGQHLARPGPRRRTARRTGPSAASPPAPAVRSRRASSSRDRTRGERLRQVRVRRVERPPSPCRRRRSAARAPASVRSRSEAVGHAGCGRRWRR